MYVVYVYVAMYVSTYIASYMHIRLQYVSVHFNVHTYHTALI